MTVVQFLTTSTSASTFKEDPSAKTGFITAVHKTVSNGTVEIANVTDSSSRRLLAAIVLASTGLDIEYTVSTSTHLKLS